MRAQLEFLQRLHATAQATLGRAVEHLLAQAFKELAGFPATLEVARLAEEQLLVEAAARRLVYGLRERCGGRADPVVQILRHFVALCLDALVDYSIVRLHEPAAIVADRTEAAVGLVRRLGGGLGHVEAEDREGVAALLERDELLTQLVPLTIWTHQLLAQHT